MEGKITTENISKTIQAAIKELANISQTLQKCESHANLTSIHQDTDIRRPLITDVETVQTAH